MHLPYASFDQNAYQEQTADIHSCYEICMHVCVCALLCKLASSYHVFDYKYCLWNALIHKLFNCTITGPHRGSHLIMLVATT